MRFDKRLLAVIAVVLLAGALAGSLWLAGEPLGAFADQGITDAQEDELEGKDTPVTDEEALEQASAAALDYTGEGRVTDTEVGDEEGYYEIEVTLDNGQQVDVHLDENFNVLGQEADGVSEDD